MIKPRIVCGVVLREHLMESVRRPAYTSRRLDGHRIRRCSIKQIGVNCDQVQDLPADILPQ